MTDKQQDIDHAFLREVDDELRREQLTGWWQRWGRILVAVVGIGLVAFAGWLWWHEDRVKRAGEHAILLSQAFQDIDQDKNQEAAAKLATLERSGADGYAVMARLTRADQALKAKRTADAVAGFRSIANDAKASQPLRDLALIRQTAVEFDQLKPADVVARMKPLAVEGGPWFGSAGEMLAVAYLKDGKADLAAPLFAAIARDESLPSTLRARAAQVASQHGIDVVPEQEGTAEGQTNETGAAQ